jgi:hypothetical protein
MTLSSAISLNSTSLGIHFADTSSGTKISNEFTTRVNSNQSKNKK